MITKSERIRLGLFIFLGTIIFVAFVLFTAGRNLLKKNDFYYIEYTESVSGLNVGNPVKRRGVEIGQVKELSFSTEDVSKIVVKIAVKKGTEIKSDAQAVVQVFGITGIKFIDIIGGSNEAEPLSPEDKIKPGISTIDMVTGKADVITQKIEVALNNIISFTADENMGKLVTTLNSVGQLSQNINILIKENRDNINKLTGSLSRESGMFFRRTNRIFARIDTSLKHIDQLIRNQALSKSFKNLENISGQINDGLGRGKFASMIENINKTLKSTNQAIRQFNATLATNRDKLNTIMERLEITVRNLSDFTQAIKENPSLLIRKQGD
jgi:phospholipid/cholesterol/gamma-HCH transport system substrate-binding protein